MVSYLIINDWMLLIHLFIFFMNYLFMFYSPFKKLSAFLLLTCQNSMKSFNFLSLCYKYFSLVYVFL